MLCICIKLIFIRFFILLLSTSELPFSTKGNAMRSKELKINELNNKNLAESNWIVAIYVKRKFFIEAI